MAQVLYRKYRPRSFADLIGQEHVVRTLTNAIARGEVAHAYLFTGPRGTGKTSAARVFAKALNCTKRTPKSDACLKCESCQEIEKGNAVDLIEIDAASNRGIDEIRALREGVRFMPVKSAYKVYIIDEVHMLTKEAFNALLKTIEEPPAHAVFILATTEVHKVPATIISRTQRFDFHLLNHEQMEKHLATVAKAEGATLGKDVLGLVIAASGGSLRDAQSILGKVIATGVTTVEEARDLLGMTDTGRLAEFFNMVIEKRQDEALAFVNDIAFGGGDIEQFAQGVLGYARVLLVSKVSEKAGEKVASHFSVEELARVALQAKAIAQKDLYTLIKEFLDASSTMKYSPLPQLPLELAVVNSTQPDPSQEG